MGLCQANPETKGLFFGKLTIKAWKFLGLIQTLIPTITDSSSSKETAGPVASQYTC